MPIVGDPVTPAQVGTMALTCKHAFMVAHPMASLTASLAAMESSQRPHAQAGTMVQTFHLASMLVQQMPIHSVHVFLAVLTSFLQQQFELSEFFMQHHSECSFCPSKLLICAAGLV